MSTCSMSTILALWNFYYLPSIAPGRIRSSLISLFLLARHGEEEHSPCATPSPWTHAVVDAPLRTMHLDHLSLLTEPARARADRLDTPDATTQTTAMPRKDMTRRKDADQPRRTRPRLAIRARPEPRHDLRSLLDTPSGRRSTTSSRARRPLSTTTRTDARQSPLY